MVKIAENPQIIHKDRYYLWSYIPDSTGRYSRVTKTLLFRKHICGIPFYTRLHAKRMMVYKLGVDSLSEVKIVSGKKLLKEGIEFLPKAALKQVWYKNKLWNIKKWIFPPDYAYNKHRRRRFSTRMIHILKKYGKKRFNQELIRAYYGYRIGFKFSYKNLKRYQINSALVPEICKALSIPKRDIKVLWKGGNSLYYRGSITPFLKKGTPQYEALYPKIKKGDKKGSVGRISHILNNLERMPDTEFVRKRLEEPARISRLRASGEIP